MSTTSMAFNACDNIKRLFTSYLQTESISQPMMQHSVAQQLKNNNHGMTVLGIGLRNALSILDFTTNEILSIFSAEVQALPATGLYHLTSHVLHRAKPFRIDLEPLPSAINLNLPQLLWQFSSLPSPNRPPTRVLQGTPHSRTSQQVLPRAN